LKEEKPKREISAHPTATKSRREGGPRKATLVTVSGRRSETLLLVGKPLLEKDRCRHPFQPRKPGIESSRKKIQEPRVAEDAAGGVLCANPEKAPKSTIRTKKKKNSGKGGAPAGTWGNKKKKKSSTTGWNGRSKNVRKAKKKLWGTRQAAHPFKKMGGVPPNGGETVYGGRAGT